MTEPVDNFWRDMLRSIRNADRRRSPVSRPGVNRGRKQRRRQIDRKQGRR